MPDIVSYNGIDVADIISINGLDVPAGRGIGSGTYMLGDSVNTWVYNLVSVDSDLGPEQYALTSSTAHTL